MGDGRRGIWLAGIAVVCMGAGCSGQSTSSSEGFQHPPKEPLVVVTDNEQVTYREHIAPLMAEYCVSCHQQGSIGPFALTSYDDAKMWGRASAIAVKARTMPPFLADDSGSCGRFEDSSWLADEDIAVFERWVEDGMIVGDASISMPPPRALPVLEGEVVSVDTGVEYMPDQSRSDDYRCFVVDSPGAFALTGFDVIPSNPRIAHHLIAYQVWDEEGAAEVRRRDAESEGPGYDCLGTGPGVDAVRIATWAPGKGATSFPEGTGLLLDAERPIILEMHYNIAGGPGETDRTALAMKTAPSDSVSPLYELWTLDTEFSGPPGMSEFTSSNQTRMRWLLEEFGVRRYRGDVLVWGVHGHMHERGLSMSINVDGDDERCLLDIPRWDFAWQLNYWLETPIRLSAREALHVTCSWTTMGMTEPLTWGEGTQDEMCLGGAYVTLVDE